METYIIYALTLTSSMDNTMALNFKNLSWMMSSRDEIIDTYKPILQENKSTTKCMIVPAFLALLCYRLC